MREIKFRFWSKLDAAEGKKAMRQDCYSDSEGQGVNELLSDLWSIDIIPMQFTGLKDKNGKDIYEGDLVYARSSAVPEPVTWSNERAGWYPLMAPNDGCDADSDNFEVIGNIYENPELLEGK